MPPDVHAAYARRAEEYAEHLGSMRSLHPSDVHLDVGSRSGAFVVRAGLRAG
jgi:hypothetical protein